MSKLISSFFTNKAVPETGLIPTIRIWEVTPTSSSLVVADDAMDEVGGGFYSYDFTSYDPVKEYLIRTDGGTSLPIGERFQKASNRNSAGEVWNAQTSANDNTGTFGELNNDTNAKVTTALSLLELLLKYQANRTKVDPIGKTLTVYDDDGTTPIKVFDLRDFAGDPSVTEIAERLPQP